MRLRFLAFPLALFAGLAAVGACVVGLIIAIAYPNLPSLHALTDYQPKVPLRVYTADGDLIGEFGEERRSVIAIGQVPKLLKDAIISAEDERFYQHSGIDFQGVLRAAYANLVSGGRRQGASTITMQVARNFFLTSQKTFSRKLYEALLAFKRAQPDQGPDPAAIRQPDLPRRAGLRLRCGSPDLFRQVARRAESRRDRRTRRAAEGPFCLQPDR